MSKRRKSNRAKGADIIKQRRQRELQYNRTHEYLVEDGVVNEDVKQKILDEIRDKYKDDPAEVLKKNRDITQLIDSAKVHNDTLKVSKVKASWENSRIKIAFANMGYTIDEAADEIGVSEMDLLNPNNWNGDVFRSGNKSWKFKFASDYDESPWLRINV